MTITQNGFFIIGLIYMICYQFLSKREAVDNFYKENKEKIKDKSDDHRAVFESFENALKFGVSAIELTVTLITFSLAFVSLPLAVAISVVLLVRVLLKAKKDASFYLRDWIMANFPLLVFACISIF